MKDQTNDNILNTVRRSRLTLIVLGLVISSMISLMMYRIASTIDSSSATKINLAGKQRMLVQRILTDALLIDQTADTNQWDKLEYTYNDLLNSLSQLQLAHNAFLSGNEELGVQPIETQDQIDAFASIDPQVRTLASATKELGVLTKSMIRRAPYIDSQTSIRVKAARNEIQSTHAIIFPMLEDAVKLFEAEYKADISSRLGLAKLEIVILIAVLASTMLFVIEPTFLIIRKQVAHLNVAVAHAKRADAVRWQLLTNIGHEFRTPMNSIMGFADLLNEDDLTNHERSTLVKSIFDSSTELTSLIETMQDMSAIEAGQFRVGKRRCDIRTLLTQCHKKFQAQARQKGLSINLMINQDCPQFIETDPKRLEQILSRIIDNGVKFTQTGCLNVQAKIVHEHAEDRLEIKVSDTGIGIEKDHIEMIFDPFQQAQDASSKEYSGVGLGLSISRDIAKALGGNIAAASTPGVGSTFIITVDPGDLKAMQIEPEALGSMKDEGPKPLDGFKILIVDSAKDSRMLLEHILKKTGAQIEIAMDGKQALEAANKGLQNEMLFDLILMDMQMPVMDGYFATVKLREMGINTPVIAITAHTLKDDRQHCLESGCDEYLSKPINKELLIETCVRLIHESKNPEIPENSAA